ncbi:hypothetical protein EOM86_13125, partial [Candidatus Nomurabacteria bacterium]|nr:hypothetical protein [Candidatus Nomurabacteria bacterium]
MANVEIKLLSSLDKIFGNEITLSPSRTFGSMLMNDLYSFQIAVRSELPRVLRLKVISDAPLEIMIYKVGKVPCGLHIYGGMDDDDYISKELKDFPDLLTGYEGSSFSSGTSWLAFWVTLKCTGYPSADPYNVVLSAENENQQIMAAETFKISIIKRELPKQKLIHTEWIYLDSIAQYYNIDLFSEKFWELLANYLETASEFSMNMLLTPVLTPLLNTRPGVVRPDVQLTDVFYDNGRYTFGFDKLRRYIRL